MMRRIEAILRHNWLEKRSFNITKYLGHIIKVFEDFKLVQEIRVEIERAKPNIALATS